MIGQQENYADFKRETVYCYTRMLTAVARDQSVHLKVI